MNFDYESVIFYSIPTAHHIRVLYPCQSALRKSDFPQYPGRSTRAPQRPTGPMSVDMNDAHQKDF